MNQNKLPRGIRNNNPANIIRTYQRWKGMSKVQIDDRFIQFEEMKYGVRAFFILARTYRRKYGIKTIESFIERFAPANENNVANYIAYIRPSFEVSNGFLVSDLDYARLLYCIIRYENYLGSDEMSDLKLEVLHLEKIRKEFNIKIIDYEEVLFKGPVSFLR